MGLDTEQSVMAVGDISSRHGVDNGLNGLMLAVPGKLIFDSGRVFGSQ